MVVIDTSSNCNNKAVQLLEKFCRIKRIVNRDKRRKAFDVLSQEISFFVSERQSR